METQILYQIRRTNELLEWVIYLLCFMAVVWMVRGAFSVIASWRTIKGDASHGHARKLYQKEKYFDLLDFCEKRLEKNPRNEAYLYWKAKAKHKIGREDDLGADIAQLLDLAPRWKEGWMEQYIKEK